MSYSSLFAIAVSHAQVDYIVAELKAAQFSPRDISALLVDGGTQWKRWLAPAAEDGSHTGGWRWIAGIGALPVPEIGRLVAAGPMIAALCGMVRGAAGRCIADCLSALGIAPVRARQLEGRVRSGNILISVHSENPAQIARASRIFSRAGAQELCGAEAWPWPMPAKRRSSQPVRPPRRKPAHGQVG